MADAAGRVEFAVLGPLEVRVEGRPVALGGTRQRAVLAALLLSANETVPIERLIEQVWGDDPPVTVPKMVQVYVSRLRSSIEGDRGRNRILVTRPRGYMVLTPREDLDLTRFADLVESARSLRATDPGSAAERLRSAIALWRGAPLSDLAGEPFAQLAATRLEAMRLGAVEDRIEADLAVGRGPDLVGELEDLVRENPLREGLQGFLMLALYRAGRQAEALDVFARARQVLTEDLGIEPGPELQRLQASILRQEPWLDAPRIPKVERSSDLATPPPDLRGSPPGSLPRRLLAKPARLAAIAAVATLAAGIALSAGLGPVHRAQPVAPAPNSVGVLDPTSNMLVDDVAVGAAPGPITTGDGSAWVGNVEDHTLTRIDLRTNQAVKTFGLPSAPTSLATSAGIVWIGNGFAGTLSRVLDAYDQVMTPFYPGPSISGLVAIAGTPDDLWVGLADQSLLRLDPANLRPRASIHLDVRARAIAVTGDAAWILDFRDRTITRIDLARSIRTASVTAGGSTVAILSASGSIWVATASQNAVLRIDPQSGRILATIPLTFSPIGMAADNGAIWVAGGAGGTMARIDPTGAALVTTVVIGRPIGGVAVGNGRVWMTLD